MQFTENNDEEKIRNNLCEWVIKLNYRTESDTVRMAAYKNLRNQLDKIMKKSKEIIHGKRWPQCLSSNTDTPLIFSEEFKELIKIPFSLPIIGAVHGAFLLEFYLEYVISSKVQITYCSKEYWAFEKFFRTYGNEKSRNMLEIEKYNNCKRRISGRSSKRKAQMKKLATRLGISNAFSGKKNNIPRVKKTGSAEWEWDNVESEWNKINNLFEYVNFEWDNSEAYTPVNWQIGPKFANAGNSLEGALRKPQRALFTDYLYSAKINGNDEDKPTMENEQLQFTFFRSELIRMNLELFINQLYQQELCMRMLKNKYVEILPMNNIYIAYIFKDFAHFSCLAELKSIYPEKTKEQFDKIIQKATARLDGVRNFFEKNKNSEVQEKSAWESTVLMLFRKKMRDELRGTIQTNRFLAHFHSLCERYISLDDRQYNAYCELLKDYKRTFHSPVANKEELKGFIKTHQKDLSILVKKPIPRFAKDFEKIWKQLGFITGKNTLFPLDDSDRVFGIEYLIAYMQLYYLAQEDVAKEITVHIEYYGKKRGKEDKKLRSIFHQSGNFSEDEISTILLLMHFIVFCNHRLKLIYAQYQSCRYLMSQILWTEFRNLDYYPEWRDGIIAFEKYNMEIFRENPEEPVLILSWCEDYFR